MLSQLRAAFLFVDPVPRVIHQMKYNGLFALAEPLAALMVDAWPTWRLPIDLVLSVPLHPERKRARGYNQSELLVHHLCAAQELRCDPDALHRIRNTRPQVDLSGPERISNVAGAFSADAEKVKGRNVLLVDDVYTTGSTLSEAAEALLAAGAHSVSGYCLARSP